MQSPDHRSASNRTTPVISRIDFRYPSKFENGNIEQSIPEEVMLPDRTVNYRKCILPFALGVILMLAGITLCLIGMVLREKYDIYSFLGAICILMALMFMVFWYTCSLEVQDREMPKIKLPERSKVPPKWLQNTLQRTPTKSEPNCITSTPVACKPQGCFSRNKSENLLATNAVVELSELSTPSSSSNNLGRQPGHDLDIEGEINPSFVDGHEDTPC